MGKINLLSAEICNRISAGEVIDRPYSVVKELIENSIDAGANEIEIHIEKGGKQLISVSDNGCGIEKEDMRAAFFAHATSKISSIDDIDHIHTLGFRGEALATIFSVSQVELVSAVEGEDAYKVEREDEYIGKVQPAVAPKGTCVTVRNLFFNTPVRYKFMKSDKKEEGDITNFVTRYILGNPSVSFRYYIDGKLALQSYGGGLEEAIAQVYGANYLPNCFKISADRNDIKIDGFIGNQNFFKANKTYQSIFLNGRYIVNNVISTAIANAYSAYTMKRQYPFYVLNIHMPEDMVDVNVHPNKADVRFVDNSVVYGTVYKVISSILDGSSRAADFVVESSIVPEIKSTAQNVRANSVYSVNDTAKPGSEKLYAAEFRQNDKVYDRDFSDVKGIEQFTKSKPDNKTMSNPATAILDEQKIDLSAYENYEAPKDTKEDDVPLWQALKRAGRAEPVTEHVLCSGRSVVIEHEAVQRIEENKKYQQSLIEYKSCKYRGTLFNTYLLYEIQDEVYIIDQHAAHERLIYDELIRKFEEGDVARQGLLVPYIFMVNAEEKQFLEDNFINLREIGFNVEQFGMNSYRVLEVPAYLPDLNPEKFFAELMARVGELKKIKVTDILKEKIAQTACKHAVKGGNVLTEAETSRLFDMLRGDMGLKCPHGRPICVKLTKTAIEKMFKRIV